MNKNRDIYGLIGILKDKKTSFTGSFKPTKSLADEVPDCAFNDFSFFTPRRGYVEDYAERRWQDVFAKEPHNKNCVVVDVKDLPSGGVISFAIIPAYSNTKLEDKYSYEYRRTLKGNQRGCAYAGFNYEIKNQSFFDHAVQILKDMYDGTVGGELDFFKFITKIKERYQKKEIDLLTHYFKAPKTITNSNEIKKFENWNFEFYINARKHTKKDENKKEFYEFVD